MIGKTMKSYSKAIPVISALFYLNYHQILHLMYYIILHCNLIWIERLAIRSLNEAMLINSLRQSAIDFNTDVPFNDVN